ncbi:MAG: hypothetical protein N2439_01230, partial [Anaerolineae bacterium]|nr:hypothetical protein [Anaerolineae bacterium]
MRTVLRAGALPINNGWLDNTGLPAAGLVMRGTAAPGAGVATTAAAPGTIVTERVAAGGNSVPSDATGRTLNVCAPSASAGKITFHTPVSYTHLTLPTS